ncbi:MAG: type II and III secretion system protein family protein [Alphaproteobacteria bacterium]|jgi:pilus assembly protein CpaC|nr:type II and III secretion system protein family protein [Alphaproteobacteria bacterium]|tara:strand:- start:265 stop:1725 length:1461 start_codon:yes stop_codon:yes gene_type:complete
MSGRSAFSFLLVALLTLSLNALGTVPAQAQTPAKDQSQALRASGAPLPLGEPSEAVRSIELSAGKAQLIRLPVKVTDVIVADPAVADVVVKSPELVYLLGRAVGSTNAIFLDAEGAVIYSLNLVVLQELGELRAALRAILPGENIMATSVRGNIVLSGAVTSPRVAEDARQIAIRFVAAAINVISHLRVVAEQQVMLRVRMVEVRRRIIKSLGIRAAIGTGKAVREAAPTLIQDLTGTGIIGPLAEGQIRFGLFPGPFNNPLRNVGLALDALESEGLIKTLAEPNLTALSGETASFLAGGEVPVPAGVDSNGNLTITFRNFGVELEFTPTVLDTGHINMQVRTEVSEVDNSQSAVVQGTSVPGFRVRRATTTVEMASGGALVIGGLLQNDFSNIVAGLPGLANLPILGALFRSTDFAKGETELVVTVSAFLVRPIDDRAIVLPTDGFAPASDVDMYLLGRLHAEYGRQGTAPPAGRVQGPIGFILE